MGRFSRSEAAVEEKNRALIYKSQSLVKFTVADVHDERVANMDAENGAQELDDVDEGPGADFQPVQVITVRFMIHGKKLCYPRCRNAICEASVRRPGSPGELRGQVFN